jgi:dynein heavy chain 2
MDAAAESTIIVRAVCATKLPTLTFADNSRFRGLLDDLFPGTTVTDARNPQLEEAVAAVAASMNLQLTPAQVGGWWLHSACRKPCTCVL